MTEVKAAMDAEVATEAKPTTAAIETRDASDIPLIRARDVRKVYPNGYRALAGVDLDVAAGEFCVCIGLSGAGKSTLIRCLNRLIEPTSGQIWLAGREVTAMKGRELRRARSHMAMVFQHFNLIPRASVMTNVLSGALYRYSSMRAIAGLWRASDRDEAMAHLNMVGMAALAGRRVDALSGGQRQRVAIARALMQSPQLLLADEPVASLDPVTSRAVMDYLQTLQRERGIAVIANLHTLPLVRAYATQVVALRAGEVIYRGPPSDIGDDLVAEIYRDRQEKNGSERP